MPDWLAWERLFGSLGIAKDDAAGRRQYRQGLEERWREGDREERWKKIRRGWYCDGAGFREELLERLGRMGERVQRRNWSGEAILESEERVAEQRCQDGLAALMQEGMGWEHGAAVGKLDGRKQWLAWWVYGQSRVTLDWVAQRLGMGHESNVSHACRWVTERMEHDPKLKRLATIALNPKSKD